MGFSKKVGVGMAPRVKGALISQTYLYMCVCVCVLECVCVCACVAQKDTQNNSNYRKTKW